MNGSGVGVFINRKSSKSCENTARSSKSILSFTFSKAFQCAGLESVIDSGSQALCLAPLHYRLTASPHSAAQLPCCSWSVSLRNWNRRMTFGQEGRNAQRSAATWCQRGENLNFMLNRILPAGGSTSTSKVRTLQDKTICVQPLIRLQRTSGPCYQAVKLNNTCFTDDGFFQVSADPTVSCL